MPKDEGWCISDLVIRISSFFGHSALDISHSLYRGEEARGFPNRPWIVGAGGNKLSFPVDELIPLV
jgi:hypothetical protein